MPADYLGLSMEWSMVKVWVGTSRASVTAPFVNILTSLKSSSATPGVLRVGGDSQDLHQWSPTGSTAANRLFSGTINSGLVDALFEAARRSGWKVILGLNLRNNNPAMAVALAKYAISQDTGRNLLALEIGNEPNGYLTEADYLTRFGQYVTALKADPVTATARFTGPAISENADVGWARDLWARHGPTGQMPFATWHDYANAPSLGSLLQTQEITDFNTRIAAMDAAVGVGRHRMGEGNDTGSGGLDTVSNVQGTTAWLIDALLRGGASNLRGHHTHSWDGYHYPADNRTAWYTPFVIRNGQASPRPGFYALALFKHALGRRFCAVSTSNATGQRVRTWALLNTGTNRIYAYVINKGGTGKAGTVSVTAPAGHTGTAFLNVMQSPGGSYGKATGIEGATLPANGAYTWSGRALNPVPGTTRYQFTLPESATALLSIP
ncbi:MAG TPA: hypothetical protein VFR35_17485 [Actinoplanes sp.]|nr:hypothetical protein [Actinoplanes sp.]